MSRSERWCTGCIEAVTPSSARRPRSASSMHWTCSIRGGTGSSSHAARVSSRASSDCPVGAVADRVHGDREARRRRRARDLGHLGGRRQHHPRAVEHPRRRRAERAVHERLHRPDPQEVGAEAGAELGRLRRPDLLGRVRHVDAKREAPVGVEPLPQAAAAIALVVVDRDDAPRVGRRHRRPNRPRLLERRALGQREVPGVALAHDRLSPSCPAARSAAELTQSVWWSWAQSAAAGRPSRRRAPRRSAGRRATPASSQPCPRSHPSPPASPHDPRAPRPSSRRAQVELVAGERPVQEVHVRVAERRAGRSAPRGRSARGRPCRRRPRARRRRRAIVSPATDSARTCGRRGSIVKTGPLWRITAPLTYATVTPRDEIDRRLEALRSALAADGLDGALIVQHTDLAYFSGTNQQAHLVVPVAGEPVLLVRRVLERARAESPLERIEPLRSLAALAAALASAGLENGRAHRPRARRAPGAALPRLRPAAARERAGRLLAGGAPSARSQVGLGACAHARRRRAGAARGRGGAGAASGVGVAESQVQLEVERVLRLAGHQGQLRFRGFNQEMHYGQVLAGPSGAVPATATRRCAAPARTRCWARARTATCSRPATR